MKKSRRPARKRPDPSRQVKDGLWFKAIPDNGLIGAVIAPDNRIKSRLPSRLYLTDSMAQLLDRSAMSFWYGGGSQLADHRPKWIVNDLADPDCYAASLAGLADHLDKHPVPVFNDPAALYRTRRDLIWQDLADVPNLIAPKCVRFKPTDPGHFIGVFEHSGFSYPVLVRPVGSHTGDHLLFIENETDWSKIHLIPWGGSPMYMTQWVSFESDAGEWRKLRLSISPDRIGLRHLLFGDGWLVHAMLRDGAAVDRELEIMLSQDDWKVLQDIGSEIRKRVGLDYFGVDLGYKSDREFVLFEANVSMSIVSTANTPEYRRTEYHANIARLEADLWRAISGVVERGRRGAPE